MDAEDQVGALQDEAARHDETCAKIEAELLTLAQTVTKEDFPLPAETRKWDAERSGRPAYAISAYVQLARNYEMLAKFGAQQARGAGLPAPAFHIVFAEGAAPQIAQDVPGSLPELKLSPI
jgi:hypothetical protein